MRRFSSYGPVNPKLHYYAPRQELIDFALRQLVGESPNEGGHYITVWAPRQTGKTWLMQQVLAGLRHDQRFAVAKLNLQHLKQETNTVEVVKAIAEDLGRMLHIDVGAVNSLRQFQEVFRRELLVKPLVLLLDEFDALTEEAVSSIAGVFRNIYIYQQDQADKLPEEKDYLLHGLALIGVRAVLGIENVTGSPFNVQRGLHVPNLTPAEVEGIFKWYEQDSGQQIDPAVIERIFYEFQGQPGLTCWFGELLTETYNQAKDKPLTLDNFNEVFAEATNALPNNNILNVISKANKEPYKEMVLELFRTDQKIEFRYDDQDMNYLYMNGVIEREKVDHIKGYVKFPCPFVQKRLFNYFAYELFRHMGRLYETFADLSDTITENSLNIKNLLKRYEQYLQKNRQWLLKDAPRRTDLGIYEAVYHFNLYMYLHQFLRGYDGQIFPEFPTGNGQIDLLVQYAGERYALELKSYTTPTEYKKALTQAARYGKQLHLAEISLVVFVNSIDEAHRTKYEEIYHDATTGVTVTPIFVETGS